jgi:carboxypeptidase Taq
MKSAQFWKSYYSEYKTFFPSLKGTTWQQFYEYANHVDGSLIRIEGDEVSYCLHIIIRFELEMLLLTGKLSVDKLEQAWNDKYKESFGKKPKSLKEGVLQDVHWSYGAIGYFPTYALGSIYAAMLFKKMCEDIPVEEYVSNQEFGPIRYWLGEHVHKYGASKTAENIIKTATNKSLAIDDYMEYLEHKYSIIYDLK